MRKTAIRLSLTFYDYLFHADESCKKEELVVRGCYSLDDTLVLVCEVLTIPLSYLTR